MRAVSLTGFVAIFTALFCLSDTVAGQSNPEVEELISLHDLGTTVSIGHYYLKQESLVSIRSYLGQVGRDQRLGVWQRCIHIAPGRYRYRLVGYTAPYLTAIIAPLQFRRIRHQQDKKL